MGKFKAGLQASHEVTEETSIPKNQNSKKPENQYSDEDMELVNVGGFKVPRIVRDHWAIEAKRAKMPISRLFRNLLIDTFGLPDGITEDDLKTRKP